MSLHANLVYNQNFFLLFAISLNVAEQTTAHVCVYKLKTFLRIKKKVFRLHMRAT